MGKKKSSVDMQSSKKIAGRGLLPGKQIARQMVPTFTAPRSSQPVQRSIVDYAKKTPADASGAGQIGYNLFSMGRVK